MRRVLWLVIPVLILLSGCGMKAQFNALGSSDQPVFIPPTLAPTFSQPAATSIIQPGQLEPSPTPEMDCTDVLSFSEDLTIPDGSETAPNASLDKRWAVRNTGTCNWGEGYSIRLIAGPELGAEPQQALIPARAGSEAVIQIQFIAPQEAGAYISAWQAFNPEGLPFGDQFFINFIVTSP